MLTFHPGVTSTVLHPISLAGPPNVIPTGLAVAAAVVLTVPSGF